MKKMQKAEHRFNIKIFFCYIFIVMFLADGILSIITCFLASYKDAYQGLTELFKIATILEMIIAMLYLCFVEKKIKMNALSYVFLCFCMFGMALGLIYRQFSAKYPVHIFSHIMPIIMMSFAYYFYQEYRDNEIMRSFMYRVMKIGTVIYALSIIVFRILYLRGEVRYGAVGASWGVYVTPFFLNGSSIAELIWGYALLAFSAISGKRSVLVGVVFVWIFSLFMLSRKRKFVLTHVLLTLFAIMAGGVLMLKTDVFNRMLATIINMFSSNGDVYYATSGRNYEIQLIAEYINQRPYMWLTGIGFGGRVWIMDVYEHYSHFSPLGYVMTGGILEAIAIYAILCWNAGKAAVYGIKGYLEDWEKPFVVLLGTAILISLMGSSLTTTPLWWFFIGMGFAVINEHKKRGSYYVYKSE